MRQINVEAPDVCKDSITINASLEQVWTILTNIDQWSLWQTDISKAKLNGGLEPKMTFDWKTGGSSIHSTLHTVDASGNFGWTGKTMGILAIHNWKLTQKGAETSVFVEESMQGFLTKVFKKTFQKNLEKGMRTWLELLKLESEK